MRARDVPQDAESFYDGHVRACYALDDEGRYVVAPSRGWKVETLATAQALDELEREVEEARQAARAGRVSPLAFHMTTRQMTPKLLARSVGVAHWRVKRHMKPQVFARLSAALLARYADGLDVPVEALGRVPEAPARVFSERR